MTCGRFDLCQDTMTFSSYAHLVHATPPVTHCRTCYLSSKKMRAHGLIVKVRTTFQRSTWLKVKDAALLDSAGVTHTHRHAVARQNCPDEGPYSNFGFKTGPAKSHPNLAKRAFSEPKHAILAGVGFETGVAVRVLNVARGSEMIASIGFAIIVPLAFEFWDEISAVVCRWDVCASH